MFGLFGLVGVWESNIFLVVILGIFVLVCLVSIVYFVDQINCDLVGFFIFIKYNDFIVIFLVVYCGKLFGELYDVFNLINCKFQEVWVDKEVNYQFL